MIPRNQTMILWIISPTLYTLRTLCIQVQPRPHDWMSSQCESPESFNLSFFKRSPGDLVARSQCFKSIWQWDNKTSEDAITASEKATHFMSTAMQLPRMALQLPRTATQLPGMTIQLLRQRSFWGWHGSNFSGLINRHSGNQQIQSENSLYYKLQVFHVFMDSH